MLNERITSRVNPNVHLRVADLLAILDEQGWKEGHALRAIIGNQAAIIANQRALNEALDLPVVPAVAEDYDALVAEAVAADNRPAGDAK